jgi:hypothetical protein
LSSEYRVFEELTRSINRMNNDWSQRSANTDSDKTFAGMYRRLNDRRRFLVGVRDNINRTISEQKNFSDEYRENRRTQLMGEFSANAAKMVRGAMAEIDLLTDGKYAKVQKMTLEPPTDEQIRLLTVYRMRDDLTELEVQNAMSGFFDNYNAMKALETTARAQGLNVVPPAQLDAETMYTTIEDVRKYLYKACDYLTMDMKDIPIEYHAFFTLDDTRPEFVQDPRYREYAKTLDGVPQLQDVKTVKTGLTPTERVKIEMYFKDVADENTDSMAVLAKVRDVLAAHPEDKELVKLSKYGSLVETAEQSNE